MGSCRRKGDDDMSIKAQLTVECKNCIEDISIELDIDGGKKFPVCSSIRSKLQEHGWSFGRDCYCPECVKALPAHCATCEHYEGNKSMGAPVCRLDGKFAIPTDYCSCYKER